MIFIVSEYGELLDKSKTLRFYLGGLDVLFEKCFECGRHIEECECYLCKHRHNYPQQSTDIFRFFAKGVEWLMILDLDDSYEFYETIGIKLKAMGKNVRADVRLTIISNDPNFPNIKIEKKNELFGEQRFHVFTREEYEENTAYVGAYVRFESHLLIELSINVLSIIDKSDG